MNTAVVASPIGPLRLTSNGEALTGLYMVDQGGPRSDGDAVLAEAERQLEGYFAGELRGFDLPLAPSGTEFQLQVWGELLNIPYGATISYGELARRVGDPKGARAVGAANGQNPISIIIPCHRVIGANGSLIGYGGGLDRKRFLLELEGQKTLF